ncbi:hypothetical protein [Tessaracoccus flavescens]|uniref:Preprotein translocase subunit SecB n=1 Tax=Tessaracoccus flavescens TaxID=399497 RepID=A0A1Q2CXV0_9ACTN|nr:hypothetical protein [Tessaracoccus flavescens]AQP50982.1 hypothetical protein BW733_09235 [Tessaracoccus flavescens]
MSETSLRLLASRIAGQADLKDVRTAKLHAEMAFPPAPGARLSYELRADFEYGLPEEDGDPTVISGEYTIPLWIIDEDGERDQFAELSFALVALYEVPDSPTGEPYRPEEWNAFVQTTGQFALYPFARETASMLSTRLGVPPLTLGMLRLRLDEDEVHDELAVHDPRPD